MSRTLGSDIEKIEWLLGSSKSGVDINGLYVRGERSTTYRLIPWTMFSSTQIRFIRGRLREAKSEITVKPRPVRTEAGTITVLGAGISNPEYNGMFGIDPSDGSIIAPRGKTIGRVKSRTLAKK